jgi:DNA gyrase subunit B
VAPTSTALFQTRAQLPAGEQTAQGAPSRNIEGALSYSGALQLAERPLRFQQTMTIQSILDAAPELLTPIFAALSSPHRVIILRTLCEGPCTAQHLQDVLGMNSSGQLYHHLKELQAAGLISQPERSSSYVIDPTKLIPICVALMAALTVASFFPGAGQGTPPVTPHQENQQEHRDDPAGRG